MDFKTTLRLMLESPQLDHKTVQLYSLWCKENDEEMDSTSLDKFLNDIASNIKDFINFNIPSTRK